MATYERLPALAADLVRYGVAAIAVASADAAHAAKTATTRIPIVFFMRGDPVTEDLVTRLNQPNGNLTGVTTFSGVLTSKRLELLQELSAPSAASRRTVRSAGSRLLPHGRCGAYAGWRLAEAPAEHAIEMRNIAKADRKRDINDR